VPPSSDPSDPSPRPPSQPGPPSEEAVARIEAGGIPLVAEQRLQALRTGGAFTSDLSTADFALCHQAGLRPLAQVMGTSVYQIGFDPRLGWGGAGGMLGGQISELSVLTRAYNQARIRALERLAAEALAVGADAVVGATWRLARINFGDQEGSLEYTIVGTAVSRQSGADAAAAQGEGATPVLTDLSVADYVKLVRAGIEPVGLAGWHAVFFTETSLVGGALVQALAGRQFRNFELAELTQAIYAAREQVMQGMASQAQGLGASGIVGVQVEHKLTRASSTQAGRNKGNNEMILHFNAFGTAIKRTGAAAQTPPTPVIDLASG
jgi:uncharacterized protein YbjQ (UPF0145 family)